MECILKSELFPKKSLVCEDESLHVPFPLLCGEAVEYLGRTADGVIALSNFRLLIRSKDSFINVPLGMVESIECREIFFLNIYCKDATVVRYTLILVLWSNYLYSWLYYISLLRGMILSSHMSIRKVYAHKYAYILKENSSKLYMLIMIW